MVTVIPTPLIIPDVSIEDPDNPGKFNPKATLIHCIGYAKIYDANFYQECEDAAKYAISEQQKEAL